MNFPWMPFPNPPNSETETHSELCFQALLKHCPISPFSHLCSIGIVERAIWMNVQVGFRFGFLGLDLSFTFVYVEIWLEVLFWFFFFLMKHACTNVGFCWFAKMCVEKPKCQCGKMGTGGAQESLLWMHGRPTKRRMVVLMFPKILYR